jgi:hypothetical protein
VNTESCGSVHETHNPQIWINWDNAICVLADQIPIDSQNTNILGSAYSEVQVAAPCSNSFQSSLFRAWKLNFLGTGWIWVMSFVHGATELKDGEGAGRGLIRGTTATCQSEWSSLRQRVAPETPELNFFAIWTNFLWGTVGLLQADM